MIEQVAVEHVRIARCQRIEEDLLIKQCERADTHWEIDRRAEAKTIFDRLRRNPLIYSIKLESTIQGCDLMIERWEGLLSILDSGQPWEELDRSQALDLLGVPKDFRKARSRIDPRPGESSVEAQGRATRSELARLHQLKEVFLIADDDQDRESTMIGLGAPNHAITLIRRYESVCQRRLQAAIKWMEAAARRSCRAMPKIANEFSSDRLRLYMKEKALYESAPVSKMISGNPELVELLKEQNVKAEAMGYPPVQFRPPAPKREALSVIDEVLATTKPAVVDERERRRSVPIQRS